jgi:hypothetical protein
MILCHWPLTRDQLALRLVCLSDRAQTVAQLKELCTRYQLPKTGKKQDLIDSLARLSERTDEQELRMHGNGTEGGSLGSRAVAGWERRRATPSRKSTITRVYAHWQLVKPQ